MSNTPINRHKTQKEGWLLTGLVVFCLGISDFFCGQMRTAPTFNLIDDMDCNAYIFKLYIILEIFKYLNFRILKHNVVSN